MCEIIIIIKIMIKTNVPNMSEGVPVPFVIPLSQSCSQATLICSLPLWADVYSSRWAFSRLSMNGFMWPVVLA
jgi:hypothetical protein